MRLDVIDNLFEAAPTRIPHPEDSIFNGSADAKKYLMGLLEVIKNPGNVSIKWDGGIALVFGYTPAGEFFINDKYMPEGFFAKSPKDWERYDTTIKKSKTSRPDLYPKIALVWEGLKADVTERAVFKGDLMAVGKEIKSDSKMFMFRPNTVEYRVPVNSSIGKLIAGKVGIIAVHQKNGGPWDGKTGMSNAGNVAVLSPTAGIQFTLNDPIQLVKAAETALAKDGILADQFLSGITGVARDAIKQYFNKKITAQTTDTINDWLKTNAPAQYKKLIGDNNEGYLYINQDGYESLKAVWNAMYALKTNLAAQLEPQVQGFEQWTGGQKAGEGFVYDSKTAGMIKLVNRGVFGVAHFNK
jgi:hypothetical protein